MSQENVEVVRATFDAWNAGDMQRLGELYDPQAVMRFFPDAPEGGEPVVGRDNIIRAYGQLRDAWGATDRIVVLSEYLTAGDRVLVRVTLEAEGAGPAVSWEATIIWTLRGGRVFEIEFVADHDEALEAVGLRE